MTFSVSWVPAVSDLRGERLISHLKVQLSVIWFNLLPQKTPRGHRPPCECLARSLVLFEFGTVGERTPDLLNFCW